MNKVLYFIITFILFIFVSCEDAPKNSKPRTMTKRELYRSALTQQDSILSKKIVATFMGFVQDGKYADAVMMLHKLDEKEPYSTPVLLDNDEIEQTMNLLKKFPVQSYVIESIIYDSAVNNPTRCRVLVKTDNGDTPVNFTWIFNPINYLGEWKLCFPMNK